LVFFIILYLKTGFLQTSSIDTRDLSKWEYENEIIKGAEGFTLQDSNETCWYLIHGYTSTPDEMKELAEKINNEFNETVVVTRLNGHSMVPSKVLNLSLDDWYEQVDFELVELSKNCNKINIVGFSFGGTLATRLAEEKEFNHIYLIAPYFITTYHFYYGFTAETHLNLFSSILHYSKKTKTGEINSPEGLEHHIAYWNMPFSPVKNSKEFLKETLSKVDIITEPLLVQHSKKDFVSDVKSSIIIINKTSSLKKQLILYEKSNHILPEDYDKDEVIKNIIEFEKNLRN
jgi:carboxylesterase